MPKPSKRAANAKRKPGPRRKRGKPPGASRPARPRVDLIGEPPAPSPPLPPALSPAPPLPAPPSLPPPSVELASPGAVAAPRAGHEPAGHEPAGFPIVGIGTSAGGLEALEVFFRHVPARSGAAYVVVQHLDPTHKGMLAELLQRSTAMPVIEANDKMRVERDHVYVIPPNKDMSLLHGTLYLLPRAQASDRGRVLPIDFFFRSLAEDQQERSIGVILSGMGSDGTLGLRAIKEKAGAAFVQAPASARFDGMPRSAIDAGLADVVAPVEELPARIDAYRRHAPFMVRPGARLDAEASAFDKLFVLLRSRTGNDFSLYKRSTIERRIERRMGLHQIDTLGHYVRFLRDNPAEIDLLFKELLIGVTSFFRDPAEWEKLRREVMPALVAARPPNGVLRAWAPGCSTGEEAYSLAMVFREALEPFKGLKNISLQIFATDLDREAIEKARQGVYPENIAADLSPERLRRFFVREERGYRVTTEIREAVVFAQQNLVMDPPFTKVDLLVCRNLLIYLSPEVQKKLIPMFRYCLNPGGILFLGSAETIGTFGGLFAPLDGKTRIYRRVDQPSSAMPDELRFSPLGRAPGRPEEREHEPAALQKPELSLQILVDRLLVQRFSPLGILCNDRGDILYISGRAGNYLEPAVGKANLNLFAMAREGLRHELSSAFGKALRSARGASVRGVKVGTNGGTQVVDLTVQKLAEPKELGGSVIVVIADAHVPRAGAGAGKPRVRPVSPSRLAALEHELQMARDEVAITREEMQTSQEELRSINEELQSTNEELTTSKEEMQSMNEELQTLNQELQSKVDELSRANNDMKNLLNSTDIATLFLDGELRVRRFTIATARIIKLIPSDVGRLITDITSDLDSAALAEDAREVIRTLAFKERQAGTRDGRYYTVRIMPYRTLENVIDGVVVTFTDASASRGFELALAERSVQLRQLAESVPSLAWAARADGAFDYLSDQWLGYTGVSAAEQLSWGWLAQIHQRDRERVREDWCAAVAAGTRFLGEFRIRDAAGSYHWFRTRAVPIRDPADSALRWYGTSTEIDGLQRAGAHDVDKPALLLDHLREGFVELDGGLAVVWLNRAAERVIERDRGAVLGKHLFDAFPGARGSTFARKLEEARAGAAPIYVGEGLELAQDLKLHDVRIYPERDPDSLTVFFAGRSTPDDQE